jgi:hypothetical protein
MSEDPRDYVADDGEGQAPGRDEKARPREMARVSRSPLTTSTRHRQKADGPTPARQPDTPSASGQPELHRVPASGAAPRTRRDVTPVSMSLSVPSRHSVDSD